MLSASSLILFDCQLFNVSGQQESFDTNGLKKYLFSTTQRMLWCKIVHFSQKEDYESKVFYCLKTHISKIFLDMSNRLMTLYPIIRFNVA